MNIKDNGRRSGRTYLILASKIAELLETGECTICDHYHSNHTDRFYRSLVVGPLLKTLSVLLNKSYKDIAEIFEVKYNFIQNNYINSVTIKAIIKANSNIKIMDVPNYLKTNIVKELIDAGLSACDENVEVIFNNYDKNHSPHENSVKYFKDVLKTITAEEKLQLALDVLKQFVALKNDLNDEYANDGEGRFDI